ncbi:MAG: hypothetical protein JWM86_495 [Thermoleophilia bacterium]|nr:hypothetical protein [Thermoleophilia bacterium]
MGDAPSPGWVITPLMRTDPDTRLEQLQLFDEPAAPVPAVSVRRRRRRIRGRARMAVTILGLGVATAGMVAGSFAAWTAQTTNPGNSVSTGTLGMTNDKPAASVFSATNVVPNQVGSSTVKITNSGNVPLSVKLTQDQLSASGVEASLRLSIHDDARDYCYWPTTGPGACATRGAWDASATLATLAIPNSTGGAQWASNEAHTFTLSWELLASSPNSDQGKTGSFRLVWNGTS